MNIDQKLDEILIELECGITCKECGLKETCPKKEDTDKARQAIKKVIDEFLGEEIEKKLDHDKAMDLAMGTDYAFEAIGVEINKADAGAFFIEGIEYCLETQRERLWK